jgi:hypothetical membrane protein
LVLSVVQFLRFHLIVQSAWPEPYSWADNNISDLGAVGCGQWDGDGRYVCSPLHAWMNASFVLQGALLAAGLVLARALRGRLLTKESLAFVSLAALGFILAGFAPADANEGLHVLAAFAVFFCGNVGLIFAENPAQATDRGRSAPFRGPWEPSVSSPRPCSWARCGSSSAWAGWRGLRCSLCRSGHF